MSIQLSDEQKKALGMMQAGYNIFLTGDAGTGKSTIINFFCENTNKNIMRCAPTAVAARLVNGATLHSAFGIPLELFQPDAVSEKKRIYENLAVVDTIVIDEISMVRSDILQFIYNTLQTQKRNIQVIAVGDFGQLPPVCKKEDLNILKNVWGKKFNPFCFTSSAWKDFHFFDICLHEVHRQNDIELIKHLQKIKIGDKRSLKYFNDIAFRNKNQLVLDEKFKNQGFTVALTVNNATAEELNNLEIAKIKNEEFTFEAITTGIFKGKQKPAPEILKLKKTCKVVALQNKYEINGGGLEYANGDIGTVIELEKDKIKIEWENGNISNVALAAWQDVEYVVSKEGKKKVIKKNVVGEFKQYPLRPAYALTIHKSQGQTYKSASIYPGMFEHGQLYVALSRVRSASGIFLNGELKSSDLITSKEVLKFLKTMSSNDDDYIIKQNDALLSKSEKKLDNDKIKTDPQPQEQEIIPVLKKTKSSAWGGKRSGAGRKGAIQYPDGTATMRLTIPVSMKDEIIDFIRKLLTA